MTALHPEATDDARTLRWVTTAGALPALGPVVTAPAPLDKLVAEGLVEHITLGPTWVEITLSAKATWRVSGPRVRAALREALAQPQQWRVAPGGQSLLQANLEQVLAGRAGDYVRSHGGVVTLREVVRDRAWLDLEGACRHCPALVFTVQGTIQRELARCHQGPFRLYVNGRLCAKSE